MFRVTVRAKVCVRVVVVLVVAVAVVEVVVVVVVAVVVVVDAMVARGVTGDVLFRTLETAIGSLIADFALARLLFIILSDSALTVLALPINAVVKANTRFILSSTQCLAFP